MSESQGAHYESLRCAAGGLMAAAGLGSAAQLDPLPGGANNRVFRVNGESGCAFLKVYFQHPDDPRDRLKAEFSFLELAWENGVRSVPRPLAQDREHELGLYEFIPGRAVRPEEVDKTSIEQAITFYHVLNQAREAPGARRIPDAAEACFSLAEHLACVERRVDRLAAIRGDSG
ncbi:MAG: phosphotransferase, partial [Deltaproteobacteria bacterium]|nr:phosphotransferase [Deltaproteobacteria bacterium]